MKKEKKPTRLQMVEARIQGLVTEIQGLREHQKSIWDTIMSTSIQNDRFNRLCDQSASLLNVLSRHGERIDKLEKRKA